MVSLSGTSGSSVTVTGNTTGEVKVTGKAGSKSDYTTVKIVKSASTLSVSPSTKALKAGESVELSATVSSDIYPAEITWTASPAGAVTFTPQTVNGIAGKKVTAALSEFPDSADPITITATHNSGLVTKTADASITITVVNVTKMSSAFRDGATAICFMNYSGAGPYVAVYPMTATFPKVQWTYDNSYWQSPQTFGPTRDSIDYESNKCVYSAIGLTPKKVGNTTVTAALIADPSRTMDFKAAIYPIFTIKDDKSGKVWMIGDNDGDWRGPAGAMKVGETKTFTITSASFPVLKCYSQSPTDGTGGKAEALSVVYDGDKTITVTANSVSAGNVMVRVEMYHPDNTQTFNNCVFIQNITVTE
jgi:hypothetical protein